MRVLVTNDDGIEAPGLHALARAMVGAGHDVVVAAPDRDMSGSSAAIGQVHVDDYVDAERCELPGLTGVPAYAVAGPPGLCVLAARLGGFGEPPELVVSGINPGANAGVAVLHSGTVGAALTGANFGVRGMAVSLDVSARHLHEQGGAAEEATLDATDQVTVEAGIVGDSDEAISGGGAGDGDRDAPARWDTAAAVAASLVPWLAAAPDRVVLNVNVPNLALAAVAGTREACLAPFGSVRSSVVESADDGRIQMELRPAGDDPLPEDCDTALVAAGFVAVTALTGIRVDDLVDVTAALAAVPSGGGVAP